MILYHGSNVTVREPRLLKLQRDLDFGRGFYTTSDRLQAENWARRTAKLRGTGRALVTVYDAEETDLARLATLRFAQPDAAWLDYVAANRRGRAAPEAWDLVIGPVADDQTQPTIFLYLSGYLNQAEAVRRLLPQRLKDQYVFKTEAGLAVLRAAEVLAL